MSLKALEADSEICFVGDILDPMMKRAPVGFLYILEIEHMIDSVFSFSLAL